jgi:hypothetical protein
MKILNDIACNLNWNWIPIQLNSNQQLDYYSIESNSNSIVEKWDANWWLKRYSKFTCEHGVEKKKIIYIYIYI